MSTVSSSAIGREVGGMSPPEAFVDVKVAKLVEAADRGDFVEVDKQVREGVDVNAVGKDGVTPLFWQVYLRNLKATEKLLQVGANPNYQDVKRRASALSVAINANRPDILDLLLLYKGDPNLIGPNGESLLRQSVLHFHPECVRLLVDKYGADINAVSTDARTTPADVAIAMAEFDLVIYFIERGLKEDLQNLALRLQSSQILRLSDKKTN
jgi:uncharacterized protein